MGDATDQGGKYQRRDDHLNQAQEQHGDQVDARCDLGALIGKEIEKLDTPLVYPGDGRLHEPAQLAEARVVSGARVGRSPPLRPIRDAPHLRLVRDRRGRVALFTLLESWARAVDMIDKTYGHLLPTRGVPARAARCLRHGESFFASDRVGQRVTDLYSDHLDSRLRELQFVERDSCEAPYSIEPVDGKCRGRRSAEASFV